MLILGIKKVDAFVTRQQTLGNDVWWDGWTIKFFRPDERAVFSPTDGAFRNGKYGYINQVPVDDDGMWRVDYRNIKRDNDKHSRPARTR